jgi:hypothetical protein
MQFTNYFFRQSVGTQDVLRNLLCLDPTFSAPHIAHNLDVQPLPITNQAIPVSWEENPIFKMQK